MTTQRDFYTILGVDRGVGDEDLKKAFRKMAMEYHPDRNRTDGAEEKFKEASQAYEVLSDPEKRRAYDQFGHAGVNGNGFGGGFEGFSGFGGFGDIFETFFGGATQRTRTGPRRGSDLRYRQNITLEEAAFGVEKEISIDRTETCSTCSGSGSQPGFDLEECGNCGGSGELRRVQQSIFGQFVNVATCDRCRGEGRVVTHQCQTCSGRGQERKRRKLVVNIPAGVDDEAQVRLSGEGSAGSRGGPPGNLYVLLHVKPHKQFRRDGTNVIYELSLNVAQAALGDEIRVPTLDGEVLLKIPAGTDNGTIMRMKERGVPSLRTRRRGDQLTVVRIVTPRGLSEEQVELFRRLAGTLGADVSPQPEDKGFFEKIKDAFNTP